MCQQGSYLPHPEVAPPASAYTERDANTVYCLSDRPQSASSAQVFSLLQWHARVLSCNQGLGSSIPPPTRRPRLAQMGKGALAGTGPGPPSGCAWVGAWTGPGPGRAGPGRAGSRQDRQSGPGRIKARSPVRSGLGQDKCLNPYIACRKDAVGVSDVIMQSSIVTGSEIGPLVTAQSLK
jgi:hypothetical protein